MKRIKPLTDLAIKRLKPSDKPITTFDGQGLHLVTYPSGRKVWRFKSKLKSGKALLMTLGEYPALPLADARMQRNDLLVMVARGEDPREVIKAREQAEKQQRENTLEKVATEWLLLKKEQVKPNSFVAIQSKIERYIFSTLGNIPIKNIAPRDVLELLKSIETTSPVIARRCKGYLTDIFAYAIRLGITDNNPAGVLVKVLKPYQSQHRQSLPLTELPAFLRMVQTSNYHPAIKSAVRLLILLFMRRGEIGVAKWVDIDLETALWRVPAENTKNGRGQVYPLPRQAVSILEELRQYTGNSPYVFNTGKRGIDTPLGYHTIYQSIVRLGYAGKMTLHGFRALATSWLDEQKTESGAKRFSREAIERQLSHLEKGQTNQAYHRADYMEERREMLQCWADYIDSITTNTSADDAMTV